MSKLDVRELIPEDWRIYKELRLESLRDSPDAFCSAYQDELQQEDDAWQQALDLSRNSEAFLPLVAELNGMAVGLARAEVYSGEDEARIYQLWVVPGVRGMGAGHCLLQRIICWARDLRLDALILGVIVSNNDGLHWCKDMGFHPEGKPVLQADTGTDIQYMRLELFDDAA